MSEREIREVIAGVCADLDRQLRTAVMRSVRRVVLPAALGAGLALSTAACDDGNGNGPGPPLYGAPDVEAGVGDKGADDGPAVLYGVPDGGAALDGLAGPLYGAPTDAADGIDGGAALYSAPLPDGATVKEGGAVALYSAPLPDGAGDKDGGAAPLYAAPT